MDRGTERNSVRRVYNTHLQVSFSDDMRGRGSVIINNLHLLGTPVSPEKTQSELPVNPYRVLPLAIPLQGLQMIGRRLFEIIKILSRIQLRQPSPGAIHQIGRKPLWRLIRKKLEYPLVTDAANHTSSVSSRGTNVKNYVPLSGTESYTRGLAA